MSGLPTTKPRACRGMQPAHSPLRRFLAQLVLLVWCVQSLALVPLVAHWTSVDHGHDVADCHPAAGEGDDGCDPSCACLGCPAHGGGLALLVTLNGLGPLPIAPPEGRVHQVPPVLLLVHSVFRPPAA
ncbi:MAG: hypothetical protein Q8O14_02245 [bacterium]|jgi:hypothetical protein|nr:hypothetical protein [bacterium]